MSERKTQPVEAMPHEGILTLAEAAAFLRVDEAALAEMASQGGVPAQLIGGEWRFLKRALIEWLHWGPRFQEWMMRAPPSWILEYPPFEALVVLLEKQLLSKMGASEQPSPPRGSKQAVRKHFGIFQQDADIEERLADIVAQRKVGKESGQ